MLAVWRAAVEQFDEGKEFVLATILSAEGSSPRHVGTRFLVCKDGKIVGTIGGGLFESDVQRAAKEALEQRTSYRVGFSFRGKDASSSEMICGGNAQVLVEYVDARDRVRHEIFKRVLELIIQRIPGCLLSYPAMPQGGQGEVRHLLLDNEARRLGGFPGDHLALEVIPPTRLLKPAQVISVSGLEHPVLLEWIRPHGTAYIFGAGHVGQCVARLAAYVNFVIVLLDDRAEFASRETVPDADQIIVLESFRDAFKDLPVDEESYIVIVTRGHAHDQTVLQQALRSRAGYIGMIGSRRKTRLVLDHLLKEGFTREDINRVHAPIGLPIGGETPQEIAVSIIAEMIQIRSRKDVMADPER
jgi:xanthine dehydrogenase accessory factor